MAKTCLLKGSSHCSQAELSITAQRRLQEVKRKQSVETNIRATTRRLRGWSLRAMLRRAAPLPRLDAIGLAHLSLLLLIVLPLL
jgi:hypothetical protein